MLTQRVKNNWEILAFSVLVLLISVVFFVGYQGMDDFHYVNAADHWLDSGPFIGENHWHNRLPLVLSIALSFQIFGKSELSLVLPNILIFYIFVVFYWLNVRSLFGRAVSNIASLLLITTPLFSTYLTIGYPVIIETCFVVAAFMLFLRIAFEEIGVHEIALPVLAGALLGIAFLNRQTAAAGVIALVPLFFMSLHHWRRWVLSGVSFTSLVTLEHLWYWLVTGNFFNRFFVDTAGHKTPSFHLKGGTFEGSPLFNVDLMSRWYPSGTFDVHWLVNPYLDFFTTASYGFLFWLAVPGIVLTTKFTLYKSVVQKKMLIGLIMLIAVWFLVTVYVLSLRPQARYFGPMIAVLPIFAAIGLDYMLTGRARRLAMTIFVIVILTNLVLGFSRARPLELEREAAKLVLSVQETVYMPQTLYDTSQFFLNMSTSNVNAAIAPAPPGALELVVAEELDSESEGSDAKRVNALIDYSAVTKLIPLHLMNHLFPSHPVLRLVRK